MRLGRHGGNASQMSQIESESEVNLEIPSSHHSPATFYHTIDFGDVYFTIGLMSIFLIGYVRTSQSPESSL